MLKKYKLRSLKKHSDNFVAERDVSQRNSTLNSLGILIDEALVNDFEKLSDFGVELGLQRKEVKIFTFAETQKSLPSLRQNQISNKEFSWRGEIKNEGANDFLNVPFDVLIGYYSGTHTFLDMMVAQSRAKFKIGFNGADQRFFDLLLTVDLTSVDAVKEEVIKYLKILKKI